MAACPDCVNSWRRLAEFRFFFFHPSSASAAVAADGSGAAGCAAGPNVDDADAAARSAGEAGRGSGGGSEADAGFGSRAWAERLVEAVSEWLRLDPVSRPGLKMLAAAEQAGLVESQRVVGLLGEALDYGPDPALQDELLRLVGAGGLGAAAGLGAEQETAWAERREWWPGLHGPGLCGRLWCL